MKRTTLIPKPALNALGALLAGALCCPSAFAATINKAGPRTVRQSNWANV